MMKRYCCAVILILVLASPLAAQLVDIPDPNLRRAVRSALNLTDDAALTQASMTQLTHLDATELGIKNLSGLEFSINLTWLALGTNPITDLTPIARLTQLETLFMWATPVSDITPLANLNNLRFFHANYSEIADIQPIANLVNLEELSLSGNGITDISPLSNLLTLNKLYLEDNRIVDVRPLAGLSSLLVLSIGQNLITDHSPLDGLSLTDFRYDQPCEEPALPLQPRIENRIFPSLFTPWGFLSNNQPHLTEVERFAQHDLYFCCIGMFPNLHLLETAGGWQVRGPIEHAVLKRDAYLSHNPNMVFLAAFNAAYEGLGTFPDNSDYWVRSEDGNILTTDPGVGTVNLSHPKVQERIIQRAVAVSKCGLYDGIMLDFWNEDRKLPSEVSGMVAILKGIRQRVRHDFLIMGNTNRDKVPTFAPYMNGSFFESGVPHHDVKQKHRSASEGFSRMEDTLRWAEENFRSPRINSFLAVGYGDEPIDSPTNRRHMRAITTLNLTFSDGYVMYHLRDLPFDGFYWYDFWDADLGRPVGEKSQLYQETEGLYIREFTNGWAVYNHSGTPQVITLPEEAQGVASGLADTEHAIANLDGEMYLRVKLANPADLNGDGLVNLFDLTIVAQAISAGGVEGDVNGDGVVNVFDPVMVAEAF